MICVLMIAKSLREAPPRVATKTKVCSFEDERSRVHCARRKNQEQCQVQIWFKWSGEQQTPILDSCCTCAATFQLNRDDESWYLKSLYARTGLSQARRRRDRPVTCKGY